MKAVERRDVPGTWVVVSGPETYNCDLREPFDPTCDCADFLYRERICKHLVFCMAERDGQLA